MSLAPRVVLVHRTTEYEELVARHGTHGQAAFFLTSRGRSIEEVSERHTRTRRALADVASAIPLTWRQARLERDDLDRFLFAPEDVVVVVGQDGLVANVAKYLTGQPVVGIDTDPGRNPGVLVRHRAADTGTLISSATAPGTSADELTMVEAVAVEPQASSGVLVGTGTGATGWIRSVWQERGGGPPLPAPTEDRLLWFVREAWPSPATGTSLVAGELPQGAQLRLTVESDRLIAFGDGVESDALELTWGQSVRVGMAEVRLRLLV